MKIMQCMYIYQQIRCYLLLRRSLAEDWGLRQRQGRWPMPMWQQQIAGNEHLSSSFVLVYLTRLPLSSISLFQSQNIYFVQKKSCFENPAWDTCYLQITETNELVLDFPCRSKQVQTLCYILKQVKTWFIQTQKKKNKKTWFITMRTCICNMDESLSLSLFRFFI